MKHYFPVISGGCGIDKSMKQRAGRTVDSAIVSEVCSMKYGKRRKGETE